MDGERSSLSPRQGVSHTLPSAIWNVICTTFNVSLSTSIPRIFLMLCPLRETGYLRGSDTHLATIDYGPRHDIEASSIFGTFGMASTDGESLQGWQQTTVAVETSGTVT